MFADIEGYTSMFQRDESAGLEQIQDHRNYLQDITHRFRGQIIQYFGDGSLTVFDSVIDAVNCAIALQKESIKRKIPLRIGIHIGDLVMRSNDIFGDVVNVASRIQSAGIAGSVIVSKKVADELSNQPGVKVKALGHFTLKNVREPQFLYAIVAPGLALPGKHHERKWLHRFIPAGTALLFVLLAAGYFFRSSLSFLAPKDLRHERIYVMPFTNNTNDSTLNIYSAMAKDWITRELVHSTDALVFQGESVMQYTKADISGSVAKANPYRRLEADIVIEGSFSYAQKSTDSIIFFVNLIKAKTNEVIPVKIPDSYCLRNETRNCLEQISSAITGYWNRKNVTLLSQPTNEAYDAYWKAKLHWAEPDKTVPLNYLRDAIRLDTTFLDAYFLLINGLNNEKEYGSEVDTLKLIKLRFKNLTESQENYVRYHEEDLNGNRKEAFRYFIKEYEKNKGDLFTHTTAMVMATEYLNDPLTTIRISQNIDMKGLDLNTCHYCRTSILMAMIAYDDLSNMEKASEMAELLELHAVRQSEYTRLIEFYISSGDLSAVEGTLGRLSLDTTTSGMVPYLTYNAARQFQLTGYPQLAIEYALKAATLYGPNSGRSLARCLYLAGDLSGAEKVYVDAMKSSTPGIRTWGELGLIYARTGRPKEAMDAITQLHIRDHSFFYGEVDYLEARILAHLGKTKEAIKSLKKSLDKGWLFTGFTFINDPDLIVLNTEPEYIKLLGKNRLSGVPDGK